MAPNRSAYVDIPEQTMMNLTVDDLYNKEKFDLSTMKEDDVFKLLEYDDVPIFHLEPVFIFRFLLVVVRHAKV